MTNQSLWIGTTVGDRYCITGEIGGGGMGHVYSAIPFADPSQIVAIKVVERNRLHYEDVLRFQREASMMSRLRHPNIIAFHELGIYQPTSIDRASVTSGYYIVMEVAQGQNLKALLRKEGRKSVEYFFQLGLQVSSALEYTHGKNIIHRDIKPENIIIERGSESDEGILIKVLDFGIARLTEYDLYSEENSPNDIAGTPLYMAPENSKHLDAPIDHRADLYSLGCVLYEVLVGRPPFMNSTREKLARDHAFATPQALTSIRSDVPPILNDIVMKLVAKHPKDRYQTAFGLHVDLQRVRKILSQGQINNRFRLGRYDRLNTLPANIPMVGRQEDFDCLVESYNAICKSNSRSRLTVVRGPAGVGKTRLLKEFRAYLAKQRIRYISTSFSKYENNLPFSALANGFNEYLTNVFRTQPKEAEEIKRKVKTLLGPTASMLAQVIQGIKPYLDEETKDQAVRTGLEKEAEFDFDAFTKTFSDFTRCLANDSDPVAFIFDDMQWADEKSLEWIDRFFSHNNSERFLLILGHRLLPETGCVSLKGFLAKFSKLRRRYSEVELKSLGAQGIDQLSRSILNAPQGIEKKFLDCIERRSQGNPLYVIEFHRSLVAQEILNLNEDGNWQYRLEEIERAPVDSSSIDLMLNYLFDIDGIQRMILEVGAVVGMNFDPDFIRVLPDMENNAIADGLSSAVTTGLLLKSQISQRGKKDTVYTFTHRSLREFILEAIPDDHRRDLHRLVAKRIEQNPLDNQAQIIFTLAHHFHEALTIDIEPDPKTLEKALHYNLLAGSKALEVDSLLTAQRYYATARLLVEKKRDNSTNNNQIRKNIIKSLADISFARLDYAVSAGLYEELRRLGLNQMEYSYASYKLLNLSLLSGYVGTTLRDLVDTFQVLKFPLIKLSFFNYLKAALMIMRSVFVKLERSVPSQILQRAQSIKKQKQSSFHPFLLYFIGQSAGFNYDRRIGLLYHVELLERSLRLAMPEDIALRLVCDHAMILAFLGFKKRSYALLDVVHKQASERGLEPVQAYLAFVQSIIVDQYQGKIEDPREGLLKALKVSQNIDYILPNMQEKIFRIFLAFTQGDGKGLLTLVNDLSSVLTNRHWLTPRAVGIYLFWLLLTDARATIISYSGFIEKRAKGSGRRPEIFVRIAECVISFAAGRKEKAKRCYYDVLNLFHDDHKSPLYLPAEIDFVLLFYVLFDEVFSFEYGESLLVSCPNKRALIRIGKLTGEPRQQKRAVPILANARLRELFGDRDVKLQYDIALKRSKITQQPLIEMLVELWFGRHLRDKRAVVRVDYMQKAAEKAQTFGLHLLVTIAQKTNPQYAEPVSEHGVSRLTPQNPIAKEELDPILLRHLECLPRFKPETCKFSQAKVEILQLLHQRLKFHDMYLITADDIASFEAKQRASSGRHERLLDYVIPYFNLRSALMIPVSDASWLQQDLGVRVGQDSGSESYPPSVELEIEPQPASWGEAEGTLVLREAQSVEILQTFEHGGHTVILDKTEAPNSFAPELTAEEDISQSQSRVLQQEVNTIVPIRYANESLGLLFLERTRLGNEDSTQLRSWLDAFSAQMGIWLRGYQNRDAQLNPLPLLSYASGSYHLESCSWLHIWTEGFLRNSRESLWYLGLNVSEQSYLLVYCRLTGSEELRSPLASILWHELLVLRTLFAELGRDQLRDLDVQVLIAKQLQNYPALSRLDGIDVSFSLLQRQKGEVWSGHYGSARPMVLGSSNEVFPQNQGLVQLDNGRHLRYWRVYAQSMQRGVYILTHDTSKLDQQNLHAVKPSSWEGMNWQQKRAAFLDYLDAVLSAGQLPKYFVAIAWNGTLTQSQAGIEKAG